MLGTGGKLCFICSDRWMKNRYGKKLRELVAKDYHLSTYINMVDTDAFNSKVSVYPAITVIERCKSNRGNNATRVFAKPEIDDKVLTRLACELTEPMLNTSSEIKEVDQIVAGGEPWILEQFETLGLLRRIESKFPTIEEVGCKVGIGVATGADEAFIGNFHDLDVEPSRKLPLVTTKDIHEEQIKWCGKGVINTFGDDGKLVQLEEYPKLKLYLEERFEHIAKRHIATKSPQKWYRTIDRIYPCLAKREKLLIPDIKGDALIVYENGKLYPHHNLYFITSDEWDIHALKNILVSGIARFFVSLYSTKIRGGSLRFQAQYLRRIRIPPWKYVNEDIQQSLKFFSETNSQQELDDVIVNLYDLTADEINLIKGIHNDP